MTPRERFIAALERRPIPGRVPHFELVFFLTMEAFGKVHPSQRHYAQWYGLAAACGLTPVVVSGLLGWSVSPSGAEPVAAPGFYAFLFWVAADTSRVLVTEELAFRRMLIGRPDRAGTIVILGAALVSAIWVPLVGPDASPTAWQLVHGLATASVAGGLYVLSRSLLVAARSADTRCI